MINDTYEFACNVGWGGQSIIDAYYKDYYSSPYLGATTINMVYTNNDEAIVKKCFKLVGRSTKVDKNYQRGYNVRNLYNLLHLDLPEYSAENIQHTHDIEALSTFDDTAEILWNKYVGSRAAEDRFHHELFATTIAKTNDDKHTNNKYMLLYRAKSQLTEYINRNHLMFLASNLFIVKPYIEQLRQDKELRVLLENNIIKIEYKGGLSAGMVLRAIARQKNIVSPFIDNYGAGGDNDLETFVNYRLGRKEYNKIMNKVKTIYRNCALSVCDLLSSLYYTANGSSNIYIRDFVIPEADNNIRLAAHDSRITRPLPNNFREIIELNGGARTFVHYRECSNKITGNYGVLSFDIGRVMLAATCIGFNRESQRIRGEIADMSFKTFDDADLRDDFDHLVTPCNIVLRY